MLTQLMSSGKELSLWQAYCDHVRQEKRYLNSNFQDSVTLSLILESIQEIKCEVYSKCGFSQDAFDKLDALLLSVEQNCLHKIISEYERFRLIFSTEKYSPSRQVHESSHRGQTANQESDDMSKLQNTQSDTSVIKTEKADSTMKESMGRGKRKKFLKDSFGFLDPKSKFLQQAEQAAKHSTENCVASHQEKPNKVRSAPTKKLPMFTKSSFQSLSEDSNIPGSDINIHCDITHLAKSAKRNKVEHSENFNLKSEHESLMESLDNICEESKNVVSNNAENVNECKGSMQEHRKDNSKKEFLTEERDREVQKKSRNLKLDDGEGRVVCFLGERIDAKFEDKKPSIVKGSKQGELSAADGADTENNHGVPVTNMINGNKKDGKHNKKQSVVKNRPPGERYDLDCDKLAPMMCALCRETFPSLTELNTHWRNIHKQNGQTERGKIFMCSVCEKTFASPHTFKLHYRIHTGARPHSCSECGRTFRTYKSLSDHMTVHAEVKQFPCSICKKMFGSNRLLKQHLKRHKDRPKPHTCEFCGKAFVRRPSLLVHLSSVHKKERFFKCSYCGVSFNQKSSLNTHVRLHTGDKNHICDICGRRFNTNMAMMTHRRRHTGEKPYKCDECDYRSASSSSLKDHKSIHRNEKPFACQVANCNRRFKRRSHLISHHKTHVGVKPYKCRTCGASFALTSELQKHQRISSCQNSEIVKVENEMPSCDVQQALPAKSRSCDIQNQPTALVKLEERDLEEDIPIGDCVGSDEKTVHLSALASLPENSVVIEIIQEPGKENSDIVLSKEEMEAIVRISQQL
ncbi:zinc finger protein 235 [Elysia marginata]|uniref:Zinc finger protein 235 n=1 Tax=Elysia marginata TaxID=1093978 RepID=A0AAV4EHF4_9GAST|nr:zinc finger protein 235 [Elysia marginata]